MSLDEHSPPMTDLPPTDKLVNHKAVSERVIVRAKDVRRITGIPNSTRADKENPKSPRYDPTFPKKIKLGTRSTGYFLDELLAWLEGRRTA